MHDAGNTGCIVGAVGLELSAAQGLLEGHLLIHAFIDGICLVAVGHDGLVAKDSDGGVDDQAGVFHFGRIKCFGTDAFTLCNEDAVTAVAAAAHDKIGCDRFAAVCGTADDNASAGIAVLSQFFFKDTHIPVLPFLCFFNVGFSFFQIPVFLTHSNTKK